MSVSRRTTLSSCATGTSPSKGQPNDVEMPQATGTFARAATCMTARSSPWTRRWSCSRWRGCGSRLAEDTCGSRRRRRRRRARRPCRWERAPRNACPAGARCWAMTRSASRSCGTTLGWTNEVTSIRGTPAPGQEVHDLDLLLGRMKSGSIWTRPGSLPRNRDTWAASCHPPDLRMWRTVACGRGTHRQRPAPYKEEVPMNPNLGINDKDRAGVVKILTPYSPTSMCCIRRLATTTGTWGPQFNDLHKFFAEQYEAIDDLSTTWPSARAPSAGTRWRRLGRVRGGGTPQGASRPVPECRDMLETSWPTTRRSSVSCAPTPTRRRASITTWARTTSSPPDGRAREDGLDAPLVPEGKSSGRSR